MPVQSRFDKGALSNCRPNREQELLLRAALLPRTQAEDAYRKWRGVADVDRLDGGSMRTVPLLYHNLFRDASGRALDAYESRMKGIYRRAWYENQLRLNELSELHARFRRARTPIIGLKGVALAQLHYADVGLRPMNDIDVLVRPAHTTSAIAVLKEAGWMPVKNVSATRSSDAPGDELFPNYSGEFRNADDEELDLHCHVLPELCSAQADDDFWSTAVKLPFRAETGLTLAAAEHLIHVCAHGVVWNHMPPMRWVADAYMLMTRSAAQLDWSRVIELAKRHRLTLMMREALGYARDLLDAPVPDSVMLELRRAPVSWLDKVEFDARMNKSEWVDVYPVIVARYVREARGRHGDNPIRIVAGFPAFMRKLWKLDNNRQLARLTASKAKRRAKAWLGAKSGRSSPNHAAPTVDSINRATTS